MLTNNLTYLHSNNLTIRWFWGKRIEAGNLLASILATNSLLLRQIKGYAHFLHLLVAHAIGLEAHAL